MKLLDEPRNITINGKPISTPQEEAQHVADALGREIWLKDAWGKVVAHAVPSRTEAKDAKS